VYLIARLDRTHFSAIILLAAASDARKVTLSLHPDADR
jgi:hypothetical protein